MYNDFQEFPLNPNYPDGSDPKNPIKIYSDGVFDCMHIGHARLFEKIKKFFPHVYLVAGVCLDADIEKEKGALPLITQEQRLEMVSHCKWVDEVVYGPWICSTEFLDKIKCHYIAHDPEPYPCGDLDDVYGVFKKEKRFLSTTRTENISTTDIIKKVISNYDLYLERSIKKKVPLEELNLSTSYFIKYKVKEITKQIENIVVDLAKDVYEKDNSKGLIKEFLENMQTK